MLKSKVPACFTTSSAACRPYLCPDMFSSTRWRKPRHTAACQSTRGGNRKLGLRVHGCTPPIPTRCVRAREVRAAPTKTPAVLRGRRRQLLTPLIAVGKRLLGASARGEGHDQVVEVPTYTLVTVNILTGNDDLRCTSQVTMDFLNQFQVTIDTVTLHSAGDAAVNKALFTRDNSVTLYAT